jgi:hypothetical protein
MQLKKNDGTHFITVTRMKMEDFGTAGSQMRFSFTGLWRWFQGRLSSLLLIWRYLIGYFSNYSLFASGWKWLTWRIIGFFSTIRIRFYPESVILALSLTTSNLLSLVFIQSASSNPPDGWFWYALSLGLGSLIAFLILFAVNRYLSKQDARDKNLDTTLASIGETLGELKKITAVHEEKHKQHDRLFEGIVKKLKI